MYKVLELPRNIDTRALRKALWAERIGHRFTEEGDVQVLWLADPKQHQELHRLLTRWERGERAATGSRAHWPRRPWRSC